MNLSSLTSGLNPLNLLGGANPLGGGSNGIEGGADPLALLSQLFGASGASGQAQEKSGSVCSCSGGGDGGACSSGCSCCEKNNELGF